MSDLWANKFTIFFLWSHEVEIVNKISHLKKTSAKNVKFIVSSRGYSGYNFAPASVNMNKF